MVNKLLHEIILRFGLPRSLQSDNGTSFTSKITRGISKALGITYYLHCAQRPQSSGELKSQPILKISDEKIIQDTALGWKEALPIALLCTHIAPKEQVGLHPYEMLCGRPVYTNDPFLNPEAQALQFFTMATGQIQYDICLWGINQDTPVTL